MMTKRKFCQKLLKSKNFKQKLRHQVVEVLRGGNGSGSKLPLPHPCLAKW